MRIDIGAEQVAGNTGCPFNRQHMAGREPLSRLQPLPHGGLSNIANARQGRLATGQIDSPFKRFEWGDLLFHTPTYSQWNKAVKCKLKVSPYSLWNMVDQ